MQHLKSLLLVLSASTIISCNPRNLSPSGYAYVHHTQNEGDLPQQGDKVVFHVDIKHGDAITDSSRQQQKPASMILRAPQAINSPIEDALFMMSKGDSLSIFVQIDTLYPQYQLLDNQKEIAYHIRLLDIERPAKSVDGQTASR